MYKNSYSLFLTAFFIPTIMIGMGTPPNTPPPTNTPNMAAPMPTPTADNAQPAVVNATDTNTPSATTTPAQTEKAKITKELRKNKVKLATIKKKEKLAPALAIIEGRLNKIIASSAFKAVIEKLATKEAQEINEGKSFSDVKYSHSLSTDFPKMTKPNKFLAWVYSIMANIEHYQLLLDKLGNAKEGSSSAPTPSPSSTATPPTPTAGTTPEATPPATPPPSGTPNETPKSPT